MKAVIDRFEGDYAVILLGDEEIRVDFPRKLLPGGVREGSWLKVHLEKDPEGELKQREKIQAQLKRLKERSRQDGN